MRKYKLEWIGINHQYSPINPKYHQKHSWIQPNYEQAKDVKNILKDNPNVVHSSVKLRKVI